MQIATWNVNSVRARLERLLPWLDERSPDLVCLQETKCLDEVFPREAIESAGYHVETLGQKTYNGVALLSKSSPAEVLRGFGDERFDGEARVIGASFGDWMVVDCYVVNGKEVGCEKYTYKLAWLDALRKFLVEHFPTREKVVVTGDFNVTFDDRDVFDPDKWRDKILCSEPERAALDAIVEEGYGDALRHFTQEGGIYTWWDFRTRGFRGNRGLRIDHFLLSESALKRCTGVEVDLEARDGPKPSDHAPVIATFQ